MLCLWSLLCRTMLNTEFLFRITTVLSKFKLYRGKKYLLIYSYLPYTCTEILPFIMINSLMPCICNVIDSVDFINSLFIAITFPQSFLHTRTSAKGLWSFLRYAWKLEERRLKSRKKYACTYIRTMPCGLCRLRSGFVWLKKRKMMV